MSIHPYYFPDTLHVPDHIFQTEKQERNGFVMHELSLVECMLEQVGNYVQKKELLRSVTVHVGPLSGVSKESLLFGFKELASYEGYTNAELVIQSTPVRIQCLGCQHIYEIQNLGEALCPQCGSLKRSILSGKEFFIESIEVEEQNV